MDLFTKTNQIKKLRERKKYGKTFIFGVLLFGWVPQNTKRIFYLTEICIAIGRTSYQLICKMTKRNNKFLLFFCPWLSFFFYIYASLGMAVLVQRIHHLLHTNYSCVSLVLVLSLSIWLRTKIHCSVFFFWFGVKANNIHTGNLRIAQCYNIYYVWTVPLLSW